MAFLLVKVLLGRDGENLAESRSPDLWLHAQVGSQLLLMALCLPWALWLAETWLIPVLFPTVKEFLPPFLPSLLLFFSFFLLISSSILALPDTSVPK